MEGSAQLFSTSTPHPSMSSYVGARPQPNKSTSAVMRASAALLALMRYSVKASALAVVSYPANIITYACTHQMFQHLNQTHPGSGTYRQCKACALHYASAKEALLQWCTSTCFAWAHASSASRQGGLRAIYEREMQNLIFDLIVREALASSLVCAAEQQVNEAAGGHSFAGGRMPWRKGLASSACCSSMDRCFARGLCLICLRHSMRALVQKALRCNRGTEIACCWLGLATRSPFCLNTGKQANPNTLNCQIATCHAIAVPHLLRQEGAVRPQQRQPGLQHHRARSPETAQAAVGCEAR